MKIVLIILLSSLCISGCGQTGKLYLPEKEEVKQTT